MPSPTRSPADLDGTPGIGLGDFSAWRDDFVNFVRTNTYNVRSDLYPPGSPDGRIDIQDFSTWRDEYLRYLRNTQ